MANTYSDITAKIAKLQAEADRVRNAEVADVIARARKAIEAYGITVEDLFGGRKKRTAKNADAAAKYSDEQGNTWGGRGPRPQWLRDALAAGATLESFARRPSSRGTGLARARQGASATRQSAPKSSGRAGRSRKHREREVKFRDEQGNTWGGRGPQPRWLRDAIAAGKSKDDFKV